MEVRVTPGFDGERSPLDEALLQQLRARLKEAEVVMDAVLHGRVRDADAAAQTYFALHGRLL